MHNVSHSTSESNNPHTLKSWSVGLADNPHLEMLAAEAEQAQIHAEMLDQLADLARIEAEQDRQQAADIDSDFIDYIGKSKIHAVMDCFESHNHKALFKALAELVVERSIYRNQFAPAMRRFA